MVGPPVNGRNGSIAELGNVTGRCREEAVIYGQSRGSILERRTEQVGVALHINLSKKCIQSASFLTLISSFNQDLNRHAA